MAEGTIDMTFPFEVVKFKYIDVGSNTTSDTFAVSNYGRRILLCIDSRSELSGLFLIATTGGGGVSCNNLGNTSLGTGLTFDVSTNNRLKISHTSRLIIYIDVALTNSPFLELV